MIKFDLEKALAGEKVVTRDGREITGLVRFPKDSGATLYGLDIANDTVELWFDNGCYHDVKGECGGDLFMAPKKLSGFVNVWPSGNSVRYSNRTLADNSEYADSRIACIDLSQFEEGHGL